MTKNNRLKGGGNIAYKNACTVTYLPHRTRTRFRKEDPTMACTAIRSETTVRSFFEVTAFSQNT